MPPLDGHPLPLVRKLIARPGVPPDVVSAGVGQLELQRVRAGLAPDPEAELVVFWQRQVEPAPGNGVASPALKIEVQSHGMIIAGAALIGTQGEGHAFGWQRNPYPFTARITHSARAVVYAGGGSHHMH